MTKYNTIVGLEVHAELKTKSKMFCGCNNDPFGAEKPNMYTCPVCLGLPGGAPVANKKAIEWTIKLGLALNCKINLFSKFDRKHYFYPDLPKGYQISQYDVPFCYDGYLDTDEGRVEITRIHLEEDTGKSVHTSVNGKKASLLDFNRSSVPLIEIVSEPDIKSGSQARDYGKKLRQIIKYIDIADCDMDQGGMRLEANISIKDTADTSDDLPDYKVEVKNINSFKFLEQAINFEVKRHEKMLNIGKTPNQETRGWDSNKNETFSQRTKEEAADYRYFPDPDLPPVRFTQDEIDAIAGTLPELPYAKISRWKKEYSLSKDLSTSLINSKEQAEWLETIFIEAKSNKINCVKIANSIDNKKLSVKVGESPKSVINKFKDVYAVAEIDTSELDSVITSVLKDNPDAVEKYNSGKVQIIGFLMGQTMKKLKTKADPSQVKKAIIALIEK